MIFVIDIIILGFIAYFSITKSIKSNPVTEIAKLVSMALAILGSLFLYPEILQSIVFNLLSNLFNINRSQIDFNFFNMIAFFIQFLTLYIVILSISNYFKNLLPIKRKTLSAKISTIFPSIARSILIVIIAIYSIESFPSHLNQEQSNLNKSTTYKALSKITHSIIK